MKKSAYLCNAFPLKTTREGKTERSLKFFRYAGDEKSSTSDGFFRSGFPVVYIINVYRSRDEKKKTHTLKFRIIKRTRIFYNEEFDPGSG